MGQGFGKIISSRETSVGFRSTRESGAEHAGSRGSRGSNRSQNGKIRYRALEGRFATEGNYDPGSCVTSISKRIIYSPSVQIAAGVGCVRGRAYCRPRFDKRRGEMADGSNNACGTILWRGHRR